MVDRRGAYRVEVGGESVQRIDARLRYDGELSRHSAATVALP